MSITLAPIYRTEPYIDKTNARDASGKLVTLPALVDRIAALESELAASRAHVATLREALREIADSPTCATWDSESRDTARKGAKYTRRTKEETGDWYDKHIIAARSALAATSPEGGAR